MTKATKRLNRPTWFRGTIALVKPLSIALAAFFSADAAQAEGERFVFIYHSPDAEAWWNVPKNAGGLAAEQVGVTLDWRNPPSGDLADMARIIEQTAAQQPDGVVVTIADYELLEGPISDLVARGIPVVTINSGTIEQSQQLGALMHVGQPEYEAGLIAGQRAKREASPSSFLCVNNFISNPVSVERCQGIADGLGLELGSQMIDSGNDVQEISNKVEAYLTANPETEAVITIGSTGASGTLPALERMGLEGEIYFGTFDFSDDIAEAVKTGTIDFAIDQQPFLQGYIPVIVLANYLRYGVAPSNSILSGPAFITEDNIAEVEALAGEWR